MGNRPMNSGFESPFEVAAPAGGEGGEEMYPYHLLVGDERRDFDENRFWFQDACRRHLRPEGVAERVENDPAAVSPADRGRVFLCAFRRQRGYAGGERFVLRDRLPGLLSAQTFKNRPSPWTWEAAVVVVGRSAWWRARSGHTPGISGDHPSAGGGSSGVH